MCQIIHLSPLSNRLRLLVLFTFILYFYGCAVTKKVEVKSSPLPSYPEEKIERVERIEQNDFPVAKGDDVIGRLAVIRLEKGDTLPDGARHFSLGIDAISAGKPKVDVRGPAA